jgi:hypothetical protein
MVMVTRPFIPGFSTRLLVPIFAMGISIPEETIVAVKLSGGAARTDKPVNNILVMKKNDTRNRMLAFAIAPSSSFVFQQVCYSHLARLIFVSHIIIIKAMTS